MYANSVTLAQYVDAFKKCVFNKEKSIIQTSYTHFPIMHAHNVIQMDDTSHLCY